MQSWNLFCLRCSTAWMEKLEGPAVKCPNCGDSFSVDYRDMPGPREHQRVEHAAEMKRQKRDMTEKHVQVMPK